MAQQRSEGWKLQEVPLQVQPAMDSRQALSQHGSRSLLQSVSSTGSAPSSASGHSDRQRSNSLPSSPVVDERRGSKQRRQSSFGDIEANGLQATQLFLDSLEDLRKGYLRDLEVLLEEARSLQVRVLQSTTASSEKEALKRVEACYEKAGHIATAASARLQELAAEARAAGLTGSSQADLRRQSLAGTSSKLQEAVGVIFQAQRQFRDDFEAKRSRQLRAAFPDESVEAIAALSSRSRSAASTIQDTALLQPGSTPLRTATAMLATHEELSELQNLATSARELRNAFEQAELLVSTQGEVISNIASQVHAARNQTESARDQLLETTQEQRRCMKRRICFCIFVVLALLIVVAVYYAIDHKLFKWKPTSEQWLLFQVSPQQHHGVKLLVV